eukprot:Sspe_Gene.114092::Locus_99280_Transcript_1_1_Confidence_1.000_Length_939::g.114092::m.114092
MTPQVTIDEPTRCSEGSASFVDDLTHPFQRRAGDDEGTFLPPLAPTHAMPFRRPCLVSTPYSSPLTPLRKPADIPSIASSTSVTPQSPESELSFSDSMETVICPRPPIRPMRTPFPRAPDTESSGTSPVKRYRRYQVESPRPPSPPCIAPEDFLRIQAAFQVLDEDGQGYVTRAQLQEADYTVAGICVRQLDGLEEVSLTDVFEILHPTVPPAKIEAAVQELIERFPLKVSEVAQHLESKPCLIRSPRQQKLVWQ